MLTVFATHLSLGLEMLQRFFTTPGGTDLTKTFVRWTHFVAGITWIGLLYFFNAVNVKFQKALDAQTKGKVVPLLMPRSLWYFRWGAVVTVLAGLTYYAMYLIPSEALPQGANLSSAEIWGLIGLWLLIVLVTYAIL